MQMYELSIKLGKGICSRKKNEGMGITSDQMVVAHIIYHSPNGLWSSTPHYNGYMSSVITEASQLGAITTSYFLKELANLLPFFNASSIGP